MSSNPTSTSMDLLASSLSPAELAKLSHQKSASRSGRGGGPGRGDGPETTSRKAGRGGGAGRKRGPGRPRKHPNTYAISPSAGRRDNREKRRGPGRPPKRKGSHEDASSKAKRKAKQPRRSSAGSDAPQSGQRDLADEEIDLLAEQEEFVETFQGEYDTDPETALDVYQGKVSTIHWDPAEGKNIGWRVRLLGGSLFQDGRVVFYDPYSHKHKIELDPNSSSAALAATGDEQSNGRKRKHVTKLPKAIWVRLRHADVHLATRLVWAHVKGYAWWPALVMEGTSPENAPTTREGYVHVNFMGSTDVATLRDTMDCIRPFSSVTSDPVIEKSKKKRNAKAISAAYDEELTIQSVRNQAARQYARKALAMADAPTNTQYIGKRVRIFSNEINYPDGATVIGVVRRYSCFQKKWLVNLEVAHKIKYKISAAWINLQSKECSLTVLGSSSSTGTTKDKSASSKDLTDLDLVPFLVGFEHKVPDQSEKASDKKGSDKEGGEASLGTNAFLSKVLKERCRGCVDVWSGSILISCQECHGSYHLSCVDPPISPETWQRMAKDPKNPRKAVGWTCSKCTLCLGCYQKDVVFGSHPLTPIPPTLSFPAGESLNLCSMCVKAYEADKFCPNCAHTWDDIRYQKLMEQMEEAEEEGHESPRIPYTALQDDEDASIDGGPKKKRRKSVDSVATDGPALSVVSDAIVPASKLPPAFTNSSRANGPRVDPSWYHAENNVWGYTEGDMLVCDGCDLWLHAGCAGLDQSEYDLTSEGQHAIYSKEFLCRICCRKRCKEIIEALQRADVMMIFAVPVSEQVAPNYRDVIKEPMDLQTMMEKCENTEYLNYSFIRRDFARMVLNALTFNRFYTRIWNEAKRYYEYCLENIFHRNKLAKAAPPGKLDDEIQKNFDDAIAAQVMELERVQQDESAEKKDLVAGAEVTHVTLPPLREKPSDENSCLPFHEVKLKPVDAYYCAWMDCCFTCGSSGANDTMLFCVDCGEAFHSFCANVPIHSMDIHSVAGWRCPNCKVCEISGDVPADELRMLFCEMCDRAFSLDLLDPPLKSAPSGLWICGQCVDCKVCRNTSEVCTAGKGGGAAVSLKYWSRDPEKCYRCGGCDGLANLITEKKLNCQVCEKVLRKDDDNFVDCSDCKAQVHVGCDKRAEEFAKLQRTEELFGSRTVKAQKGKSKYSCPKCMGSKAIPLDYSTPVDSARKNQMHEQAWQVVLQGTLQSGNYSQLELHDKLVHQLDWQTREMWRDEYVSIVEDAIRFYKRAERSFGDPRKMIQRIAKGKLDLPLWMGQRALRFLVLAKRQKWITEGFTDKNIEACVFAAKTAATFLAVTCQAMNLNIKQNVKCFSRVEILLKESQGGIFEIPTDKARYNDDGGKTEIGVKSYENVNTAPQSTALAVSSDSSATVFTSPLCGWGRYVDPESNDHTWRDSRECCLCHLCGDDDAGFPEPEEDAEDGTSSVSLAQKDTSAAIETEKKDGLPRIPRLGRLLPFSQGLWVHALCALWSSEVWESPRGGLVNAMEKARSRGAQLKCFGCGRPGATVGCNKANCSYNYHFPCAVAAGAVFTSKQQMFCFTHKTAYQSGGSLVRESFEAMKTLIVAPEKQKQLATTDKDNSADTSERSSTCLRVGALIVHSLGAIVQDVDGYHTEDYLYPAGYVATRIFWSCVSPRTRTVYVLKIERGCGNDYDGPVFTVTPGDNPSHKIRGRQVSQVYKSLMDRVRKVNASYFSDGDLFTKLPMLRKTRKKFFGLNAAQFFGFGLGHVRRVLESLPGVEAVVSPLKPTSPKYRFCFTQPSIESIMDISRKRAAVAAERALENSSGCARTEGCVAVTRSGGSGRITRALVRSAEEVVGGEGPRRKNATDAQHRVDQKLLQKKYKKMKSVPMEARLVARRSHIHGWGLFTKIDIAKDDLITEYMGEAVRQCIADKREKAYEISGEGSCYMFRLDHQRIIDATTVGCMARFMNHCCQPNAYAKIITVDTDLGTDKKIAVFAVRDITAGEEITYDYKFPVEDGSLRCTCGAPNCIGRMN